MPSVRLSLLAICLLVTAAVSAPVEKRAVAYYVPTDNGGSQLDSSAGLGEPLNVIISGLSSPSILSTSGIENYAKAIGFTTDCFGITIGTLQTANLGDGQGWVNQIAVMRADYGEPDEGSCLESLTGGNHFRFWRQATSGAYFLAVSIEENVTENHTIEPNGYDLGRDGLVSGAVGSHSYNGVTYTTSVQYVSGLLTPGSNGINHGISIDGQVAVLTVTASS